MRNIRDPKREAAQPIDNFLFRKKNKPQFGIMFYTEICIIFGKVKDFLL